MNEERLDLIIFLLNIMEFIRLIPVLLYYKWPQATRAMVVIDACFRILQSFLPLELSVMKRSFLIGISIDCFLNYCGDFWSNLIILNIQSLAMMFFSCIVQRLEPIDAFIGMLPEIICYNAILFCVAMF